MFRRYIWLLWALPPLVLIWSWFCSLHWTTIIFYRNPRLGNELYGRRDWEFVSGIGFCEVGMENVIPANASRAEWLRQLDEKNELMNHHWSIGGENPEGTTWGNFLAGLGRFDCYPSTHQFGGIAHQGRWIEIPYWVLTLIAVIPLAMAARRHRWRRLKGAVGFEVSPLLHEKR